MGSAYDRKFEEMKKYIPFLDNMINRLENTGSPSANPRQAQLDKIRSLRDLLQDKKKRMKMENLLKCEQVLLNLYAKVEWNDTLPGAIKESEPLKSKETGKGNLAAARSKLKSVISQVAEIDNPETLPEIARASETDAVCVSGSKEPALFQRRPNKASISPIRTFSVQNSDKKSSQNTMPKRNYTRVLVSPDQSNRRWSTTEDVPSDKPLFSRRRNSPSHKKERKYSKQNNKSKDFNITLSVPDKTNTEDILSRIVECPDSDVDFETLRGLREQILGELKKTVANDDISDLIMKSYKSKKRPKKKKEVEDGELSDSESEAIQRVYGNLVLVDNHSPVESNKKVTEAKKEPRKFQIRLVVNSEKDENSAGPSNVGSKSADDTDFEMFDVRINNNMDINASSFSAKQKLSTEKKLTKCLDTKMNITEKPNLLTIDVDDDDDDENDEVENRNESKDIESNCYIDISSSDNESTSLKQNKDISKTNLPNEANFYKPMNDQDMALKTTIDEKRTTSPKKLRETSDFTANEYEQTCVNAHLIAKKSQVTINISDQEENDREVASKASEITSAYEPSNEISNDIRDNAQIPLRTDSNDSEIIVAPKSSNETCSDIRDSVEIAFGTGSNVSDITAAPKSSNETSNDIKDNVESPLRTDSSISEITVAPKPSNETCSELKGNNEIPLVTNSNVSEITAAPEPENGASNVMKDNVKIPLLNTDPLVPAPAKKPLVSEIDILQALKNEILNEATDIPVAEVATPLLHQPKITKVLSAQEVTKKRISIEKYKEKSVSSAKPSLFLNEPFSKSRDSIKKPSLKLTEEEQQRFKNIPPLSLDDSSDEDNFTVEDIYSNLAPKSPEHEDKTSSASPIIIPSDPVKPTVASSKADVDMRNLVPILSPNAPKPVPLKNMPQSSIKDTPKSGALKQIENVRPPLLDPRMRRDLNNSIRNSPNPYSINPERTPRAASSFPNAAPNMTPRSCEMTPSHQSFDFDIGGKPKHVYAPAPAFDPRDNRDHAFNTDDQEPHWELNNESSGGTRHSRWDSWKDSDKREKHKSKGYDDRDYHQTNSGSDQDYQRFRYDSEKYHKDYHGYERTDDWNRTDCPRTPSSSFGRADCPATPSPSFGRADTSMNSYGRKDCPTTPIHPFGRSDCPTTPSHPTTPIHPFGRSDCPTTPSHPFGRSECTPLSNPYGITEHPMTPSRAFGHSDAPMTPVHPFGRGEVPMTPNHPFVRNDTPMTPNHPFVRSDPPMTPSHPFGRNDAPMTPSHPFGRSDQPMTPSHPFGRSEIPFARTDIGMTPLTPNHPFGRTDHQHTGQKLKDPRLNRNNEYDAKARRYENENRDRNYYKERRSDETSRYYNNRSDSFRSTRDDSIGRNDTGGHNYRERKSGCEQSVGRGISYDKDRGKYKDHRRDYDNHSRNYNEGGNMRGYHQRAQSVGRTGPSEDKFQRATSRPLNDEINTKSITGNTETVKSKTGRSFTIDTSVNTTFQKFINEKGLQLFDRSFEDRRRRATSVGRSLTPVKTPESARETSVYKPLCPGYKEPSEYKTVGNFVRARSVGRELIDCKLQKSFKEVRDDLISYRDSYKTRQDENITKQNNYNRYRKAPFEKKLTEGSQRKMNYSPRKNYRDPRMSREQHEIRKKYDDSKKPYGIVYSNDNIARGVIMGSGYGVKNYKIPKIKRPTEEIQTEEKDAKNSNNKNDHDLITQDIKENKKDVTPEVNEKKYSKAIANKNKGNDTKDKPAEIKPQNINRQAKHITKKISEKVSEDQSVAKTKKRKKVTIESDSESETTTKMNLEITKVESSELDCNVKPTPKDLKCVETNDDSISYNSFGIDDLDVFPDNAASDQVLSNIDALIAGLGNEPESKEDESFTKDVAFNELLENIESPEAVDESLNDISEVIKEDLESSCNTVSDSDKNNITGQATVGDANETKERDVLYNEYAKPILINNADDNSENKTADISTRLSDQGVIIPPENKHESDQNAVPETSVNSENIVSTTEEPTTKSEAAEIIYPEKSQNANEERSSTPDSTINISESKSCSRGILDSTNNKNDTNPDVSSSLDQVESLKNNDKISNQKDNSSDSIDNFLSILNKSKIKELLSRSVDQKTKKKLEQLCTIVSDDEEGDDTDIQTKNVDIKENEQMQPLLPEMSSISTETTNLPIAVQPELTDTSTVAKDDTETQAGALDTEASTDKEPSTKISKVLKRASKNTKKGKKKLAKSISARARRLTRSAATLRANKLPRELRLLEENFKEMGSDLNEVLNDTGLRSCRLAKLVDEKKEKENPTQPVQPKPVVLLEKFKEIEKDFNQDKSETKQRKKPGPKPKLKQPVTEVTENILSKHKETKIEVVPKYKPGPKSKKKVVLDDVDPYSFEDSISEATTTQMSEQDKDSCSDSESVASSKSFGSSDILTNLKKKPKRKRRSKWNSGIISTKKKRKKTDQKQTEMTESSMEETSLVLQKQTAIPDMNCFTDKTYCFLKNVQSYPCRLCHFSGTDIVKHYKTHHTHSEIPLSRMHAVLAREAIEQCEDINFQTVSKMPTEKYVCRFCYEEFGSKRANLEDFFWHVVSAHTGEYKQMCSECVNVTKCPFNLDIPLPPKELQGQLIGYICGKCHFTQISLENLKTHVNNRHNDEQTAVYTINLAVMSKKTMKSLMKRAVHNEETRLLRSSRSNTSLKEPSGKSDESTESMDTNSDAKIQSKLEFKSNNISDIAIKVESQENETKSENDLNDPEKKSEKVREQPSTDILDYPHFKICYGKSGCKEYVCCINGKDNHYRTTLMISMKKHVKTKHSELWDGYCYLCKVIVMPQGQHNFKECLQHMLDNHLDNFPVLGQLETDNCQDVSNTNSEACSEAEERLVSQQPYINVRPLSDLITQDVASDDNAVALPKIESVVSLGVPTAEPPAISEPASLFRTTAVVEKAVPKPEEPYKYEEWQSEVMAKKNRAILDVMLSDEKLAHIYKCAGRYCSFTADSADLAIQHASTHQRIGGENALICAYCDFDCQGNAIDLGMHVFKNHGRCKYACGQCFYRAVASQLVFAHMHRVHGAAKNVLETATVTPAWNDTQEILPREVAVQHYVCADMENSCKFKTYTQGRFIEHLRKHSAPYMCSICTCPSENPTELLQHLESHGLKQYQCTWCLSGCDNEREVLAHASARHPTRQPQAYLRVITSNQKDGATTTMILPLVKLNKSSVATKLVTSSNKVDDPVRQAERALELEKLITSTSLIAENKGTTATVQSISSPQILSPPSSKAAIESTSSMAEVIPIPQQRLPTPPPSTSFAEQNTSGLLTLLKTEPDDSPQRVSPGSNVICLSSDEEDSPEPLPAQAPVELTTPAPEKQKVIDLSDEEQLQIKDTDFEKKVERTQLYKCKRCKMYLRNAPVKFKAHIHSCYRGSDYECAHCSFTTADLEGIVDHYQCDHGKMPRKYCYCGVCNRKGKTVITVKAHMKKEHDITNVIIVSRTDENNIVHTTVTEATKVNTLPKRKLSDGPANENLSKRIKYGPQDLFKLPQKPILDELAYCSECEFNTKVRINLVRHIQLHAEHQSVPQTAPVNPVPHLETNEKHFDKMINLASSSVELVRPEKATTTVTLHIPPEAASRYPKYVPERQRHTCGAKGCSYISLDEAMLKCHWETLHHNSNDFHCVHCPPYQYVDTSKPLTSGRIIAHLKMHDTSLYACSSCTFYHWRKQVLEKHILESHKGTGQIMIVREESTGLSSAGTSQLGTGTAPTMDLKPWKCGVCEFKSMLRPEVVDHCSKSHNSKMQFKCPACPFRTSTIDNVNKHLAKSHPENKDDVFYYYYREGSIPDDPDGTPRWVKQRQKMGSLGVQSQPQPEVKTELPDSSSAQPVTSQQALLQRNTHMSLQSLLSAPAVPPPTAPPQVDLAIVKQEIAEPVPEEGNTDDLCSLYGQICDPNGLKYKCPLCKQVTEDSKDAMQSHLFEELQYRKWGCGICSYKAFHKTGLNEHTATEHRLTRPTEPKELPVDTRVERWVNMVLAHQTAVIETNKNNLQKQQIQGGTNPTPTTNPTENPTAKTGPLKCNEKEMETLRLAFGEFGKADVTKFCCPKCDYQIAEEAAMKDHLEVELNKIRWRCSGCGANAQNYHEAQLHCKSCRQSGQMSRPVEAVRDPNIRAAWVTAVIQTQKEAMEATPESTEDEQPIGPLENSLLVVRYEERVPTPEEEMINRRKRPAPTATTSYSPDSDDERLVIDDSNDEDTPKRKEVTKKCPYCRYFTKYHQQALDIHILRHYKLKPITCMNCNETLTNNAATLTNHQKLAHPHLPSIFEKTQLPSGPPLVYELSLPSARKRSSVSSDEPPLRQETKPTNQKDDDGPILVCLTCEYSIPENETANHTHEKQTFFAKKGDMVVKCCNCLSLFPNVNAVQEHNTQSHPTIPINYAYYKLQHTRRKIHQCGYCNKGFKFFRDLKVHHNSMHASLQFKSESRPYVAGMRDMDCEEGDESTKTAMVTLPGSKVSPENLH